MYLLKWIRDGLLRVITTSYFTTAVFCILFGVLNPFTNDDLLGRVFIGVIGVALWFMGSHIYNKIR